MSRYRSPSDWRSMLETRVGRLSGDVSVGERVEALHEIRELADEALKQHVEQLEGR